MQWWSKRDTSSIVAGLFRRSTLTSKGVDTRKTRTGHDGGGPFDGARQPSRKKCDRPFNQPVSRNDADAVGGGRIEPIKRAPDDGSLQ
jgi:hypothetical protein